jgi:parallel beta-helix repeat protein
VQCNGIVLDGAGFTLRGGGSNGVTLNSTVNVTVKNLVIDGFGRGVTVQRQSYPLAGMPGYSQSNPYPVSRNNVVSNCTFTNNYYVGISVESSTGNTFMGNDITGSQSGISISNYQETAGNTISSNLIQNNTAGIYLTATKETILGNNITSNGGYGIQLVSGSGNKIAGNLIRGNGVGILIGSTQNTIKENTIAENSGWGIRLEGGQGNNMIYRNNFINNKVGEGLQVSIPLKMGITSGAQNFSVYYIPGLGNYWSSGSEGNYWSDYWLRYPNASELGSSGFWGHPVLHKRKQHRHLPAHEALWRTRSYSKPNPHSDSSFAACFAFSFTAEYSHTQHPINTRADA